MDESRKRQGTRASSGKAETGASRSAGAQQERIDPARLPERMRALDSHWRLVDGHHLEREFELPDFRRALELTRSIGELAEERDHHPEIVLSYGKVDVRIWTHKAGGLTEKDFDLAAGIDRLPTAA